MNLDNFLDSIANKPRVFVSPKHIKTTDGSGRLSDGRFSCDFDLSRPRIILNKAEHYRNETHCKLILLHELVHYAQIQAGAYSTIDEVNEMVAETVAWTVARNTDEPSDEDRGELSNYVHGHLLQLMRKGEYEMEKVIAEFRAAVVTCINFLFPAKIAAHLVEEAEFFCVDYSWITRNLEAEELQAA